MAATATARTVSKPVVDSKAAPGRLAMLYDGECEMCVSGARSMLKWSPAIDALDLHEPSVRAQFPDLKMENLLEELHVVDDRGRIFRGARAINEVVRYARGAKRLLAYLWYIPGYAWLADRQYKKIAASRYQRDPSGNLKP